ncbi:uncharacterized protein EV420DRAFT_1569350, partial [Desarmillaria tabescens]
ANVPEPGPNRTPARLGQGFERWMDGMGWGRSRIHDKFLFYHQNNPDDNLGPITQSLPWARSMRRNGESSKFPGYSISSTFRALPEARNLIKQTYSVHVNLPADQPKGITQKWHLTAYFSQDTLESLQTVDSIPGVGGMLPPEGWFWSARTRRGPSRNGLKSLTYSPLSSYDLTSPYLLLSTHQKEVSSSSHTHDTLLSESDTSPESSKSLSAALSWGSNNIPLDRVEVSQCTSVPRPSSVDEALQHLFSKRLLDS